MLMRRKGVQTTMLAILYLLVIFAFISVAYSWFDVFPYASVDNTQIEVINDYEVDIEWYHENGDIIEEDTIEFIETYDQINTKYISVENKGGIELYSFVSFDTTDLSYEFYLNRFSYTVTEIKTINNAGMAQIFKDSGEPDSGLGVIGSYYIDTATNPDDFYKKTSIGWYKFMNGVTFSGSKPSSPGNDGDYYLYTSATYAVLYQYSVSSTSWNVIAYDDLATPLDLYLVEDISLGEETLVSSGDLASLANLLLGDFDNPNIGCYLAGTTGAGYEDGGTFFWKFEYIITSSTINSPNHGDVNNLFLKPRAHISFGEVYTIDPIEGPVWFVDSESELLDALNETTGAANKHTIRLTSSITTSQNLNIYKGLTLDLNGRDLTTSGNLTYQAPVSYNSVFLNIPSGSDLSVVNLNIDTSANGRIYIDMGGGGNTVVSNDFNIDSKYLSVAIFGDTSVDQLQVAGVINVNVSHDEADEQRLSSSSGLSFYDLKTDSADLVITKQDPGNTSRIFVSENSVVGSITAEADVSTEDVNKVQIVNLGTVGYIDLSEVVLGTADYFIDIYFDGISTALTNQIKLPIDADTDNTYVEVSMNVDVLISSVSSITEYVRVFNNVVTEVGSINKFSLTGSDTFTNDNISRPYYWVKFDTTNGKVLQVLKYGTIASFFADKGGTYDFEPVSTIYIYFDGWFEDGLEFVRNQAVTKDLILEEKMLTVDYLLKFELDAGIIDTYSSKTDMVNDFLDDYTYFYNTVNSTSIERVDLKISGDVGYSASTALVGRMDVLNCYPTDFFDDNAIRAKWLWIIEYIISIREAKELPVGAFIGLLDGEEEIEHDLLKYEIWAFLSNREYDDSGVVTMDYSNYGNGNDYIFFSSYPYTISSVPFAQGGTSFTYLLPPPQRRGSYLIGGASYGYIFGGWYKDAGFTQLIGDASVDYETLAALIGEGETIARLYAKWVPGVAKTTFTDKTEIYYNTIEESITSALSDPGSTVTLLMNTSLSSTRTINQDITLDLGIYYLTINANFTISNGNIKGTKAYLLAGTNGSVLTIANAVPIEAGVRPWSVTGNPISEFVIGGERVLDIVYTASSGSWTTNKRQVIFMYWEDGNPNNDITSDLVLKVSSVLVVTSGSNIGAPGEPGAPSDLTKTGWEFMGWNKYSGGSLIASQGGYLYLGESITKAGSAFNFSTSITESTILVAWFKDSISYSIDGILTDANDDIYYGELSTVRVVDAEIKKTGYRLVGWEYTNGVTGEVFECGIPYTYQAYLPNDAMLIAKWMPIEYTVVFDSNGGSGLMDPAYQEFTYNVSQNLAANDFTKAGYAFVGWNTAANGSGEPYTNQVAIFEGNSITLNHGTTVVLYAQWQVATYAITFNINDDDGDGSGTMSNQSLTYGSVVALSANTYTRPGYSFKGWSMSSAGTFIDFYDKATLSDYNLLQLVSSGSTLYAVWGEELYICYWTIEDELIESGVYKYDDYVAITVTKTGYTFSGWYGDPGYSTEVLSTAGEFYISSDIYYFGYFTANVYVLSFDSNGTGSSVTPTSKEVTYDSAVGTLPTPTRTNSTFVEWNTSANGSGTKYTSSTIYTVAGDTTLYAIWDFNITYELNDGTWSWTTGTVGTSGNYKIDPVSDLPENFMVDFYRYLYDNELLDSSIVDSSLRKTNWTDFSASYTDPFAIYNWVSPTLSFLYTNGYSQFFWDSINSSTYTATGGFFGTYPHNEKYANLLTHLIHLYNSRTDATPYPSITEVENPTTVSRVKTGAGFTLDGYFYGTQGNQTGSFADLRQKIPTPTLVWDSTGSSSSNTMYQITQYRDGQSADLKEPFRPDYVFGGWYNNTLFLGTPITVIPTGEVPADTYYAMWLPAETYEGVTRLSRITFDKQGGTGGDSYVDNVEYGTSMPSATAPSRTGYNFAGYYSGVGATGNKYYNADMSSARDWDMLGNRTLYAYWEAKTYTLSFNGNGGSTPSPTSKTVTYDSVVGTLPTPTRTGYTLSEWNTQANGSGTAYSDLTVYKVAGNTTIYAIWATITYNIIYYHVTSYNSTTQVFSRTQVYPTPSNYTIESSEITLASLSNVTTTLSEWTFNNWNTGHNTTTGVFSGLTTKITAGSIGNKTFYAKMKPATGTMLKPSSGDFSSYLIDKRINTVLSGATAVSYLQDTDFLWKIRTLGTVDRIEVGANIYSGFSRINHLITSTSDSSVLKPRNTGTVKYIIDSVAAGWAWFTLEINDSSNTTYHGKKVRICVEVDPQVIVKIASHCMIDGSPNNTYSGSPTVGTINSENSITRTSTNARGFKIQVWKANGDPYEMGYGNSSGEYRRWDLITLSSVSPTDFFRVNSNALYAGMVQTTTGSGNAIYNLSSTYHGVSTSITVYGNNVWS